MNMSFVKILELKNEIEAHRLDALLDERGVPHVIRRHANQALEGFFSDRAGWGTVEAEPDDAGLVRDICADLRAGGREERA
jgi:hypothetical protein